MRVKWSIKESETNTKEFKNYLDELCNEDDDIDIQIENLYINYNKVTKVFKLKKVFTDDYIDALELPKYITIIDSNAFKDSLVKKVIAKGVKEIYSLAFFKSICEEVIAPKLKVIREEAFLESKLSNIQINERIKSIGNRAFAYSNLISFTVQSVYFLCDEVFLGIPLQKCYINKIQNMSYNTFSITKNSNVQFLDNMIIENIHCPLGMKNMVGDDLHNWLVHNYVDKFIIFRIEGV